MNTTKKAIAFVICLFLFVALAIVYIFSELYTDSDKPKEEVTDAMRFKKDYEDLNGETNSSGKTIREIKIDDDNPFIYKEAEDIVKMLDNNESFVVYFGFASCPWCRSVLPSLIEAAKKNKIDKIYYVDVLNIRDKYELNDKNKAVKSLEGTKGYDELIVKMADVLDDYKLTYTDSKGKTKTVNVGEKRIFAPNVIVVKNGKAVKLETGVCAEQTDAYMELTEDMLKKSVDKFNCILELVHSDNDACSFDTKC